MRKTDRERMIKRNMQDDKEYGNIINVMFTRTELNCINRV